jgi:lysophospholipase L1-like esterase
MAASLHFSKSKPIVTKLCAFFPLALQLILVEAGAVDPSAFQHPVRVACVGDSITEGVGTHKPNEESFPAQLQALLGKDWNVHNFGAD